MSSDLGVGRPTKRRAGAAVGGLPVADPRPVFADGAVLGMRCTACRYPVAQREIPWCPVCGGALADERFTAAGTVWSSTVVAIPVGERRPPFGLAYLDLDDGPRLLVHLAEPSVLSPGTRVTITGAEHGDLVAGAES
jgi:uncharacterized OB-fold protein